MKLQQSSLEAILSVVALVLVLVVGYALGQGKLGSSGVTIRADSVVVNLEDLKAEDLAELCQREP